MISKHHVTVLREGWLLGCRVRALGWEVAKYRVSIISSYTHMHMP